MPAIGNAISLPFARMPTASGGGADPLNWFRTSLHDNNFDTTLTAALASEYADDYVLVIDTNNISILAGDKDLFVSGSTEATAEIRIESPGSILIWNNAKLNIAGPAVGTRTLSLDVNYTIPTVAIVANQSAENVGTVYIEGIGGSKQTIADIEAAWQTEELHLTHLDLGNVYAQGVAGASVGESGTSVDSVYGSNGSNGSHADEFSAAGNGGNGDSATVDDDATSGGTGDNGISRAVEHIYLNGCIINNLYAYNGPGAAGGTGGNAGSAYGGNGGNGGDGSANYPNGGNGGNGGDAYCYSNSGGGGNGGNAYVHDCYTHGQGAHSTVTSYYKTGAGGAGGAAGATGTAVAGTGGSGGGFVEGGSAGSAGANGTVYTNFITGSSGSAGNSSVRLLDDPNNKITFTTQY
jgi:hypothetical protein